jgi:hypothetical protein
VTRVKGGMIRNRTLLIALLLWGLAMIVPDLLRVVHPLGSFGFYANNDGLIYDVTGPFHDEASSPAWKAGLRTGGRVDLAHLRCTFADITSCGRALAAIGGLQFAITGQKLAVDVAATDELPGRQITLVAEERPSNMLIRGVLLLDQIAGIAVVVAAAWLVWSRPSAMSWGFFLFVNWFNPGQSYAYYAILQQWPPLLLAQDIAGCVAQAAGYAGFLLFVIRAPNDKTESQWRPVERALPFMAAVIALLLIASYGNLLGYQTEVITRIGIITGFAVSLCAFAILLVRRHSQAPEDYQRLRWVLWGSLIGLPSFLLAELASETTIFERVLGFTPTDDLVGLLYLINGVLCLLVFEAVRRQRVVSVWIPLRRVTILAFLLTLPAMILHNQIAHIEEQLSLPGWAWLGLAVVISFIVSQLHDGAVDMADRFFNRWLDRVECELAQAIRSARTPAEIEEVLADRSHHALKLASAASFRQNGAVFVRESNGQGWDESGRILHAETPLVASLDPKPFRLKRQHTDRLDVPTGLRRPVLAVPAANPARCFAVSLYGPHAVGTDLNDYERAMLGRIARDAAAIYAELESKGLRKKVIALEDELKAAKEVTGAA